MDPVMLIKIPFIQYLYGIKSMRQTVKEIEVNVAYRWFLGLDMLCLLYTSNSQTFLDTTAGSVWIVLFLSFLITST